MPQPAACTFTLLLNEEERTELLQILERSVKDTLVEEHRTRTISYREAIEHRKAILEGLARKVRQLSTGDGVDLGQMRRAAGRAPRLAVSCPGHSTSLRVGRRAEIGRAKHVFTSKWPDGGGSWFASAVRG
jgi:hypothetical protein